MLVRRTSSLCAASRPQEALMGFDNSENTADSIPVLDGVKHPSFLTWLNWIHDLEFLSDICSSLWTNFTLIQGGFLILSHATSSLAAALDMFFVAWWNAFLGASPWQNFARLLGRFWLNVLNINAKRYSRTKKILDIKCTMIPHHQRQTFPTTVVD